MLLLVNFPLCISPPHLVVWLEGGCFLCFRCALHWECLGRSNRASCLPSWVLITKGWAWRDSGIHHFLSTYCMPGAVYAPYLSTLLAGSERPWPAQSHGCEGMALVPAQVWLTRTHCFSWNVKGLPSVLHVPTFVNLHLGENEAGTGCTAGTAWEGFTSFLSPRPSSCVATIVPDPSVLPARVTVQLSLVCSWAPRALPL